MRSVNVIWSIFPTRVCFLGGLTKVHPLYRSLAINLVMYSSTLYTKSQRILTTAIPLREQRGWPWCRECSCRGQARTASRCPQLSLLCPLPNPSRKYQLIFLMSKVRRKHMGTVTHWKLTFFRIQQLCWRPRVCLPLLCLCCTFCIFERCLDSNPESYQLSQPSPYQLSHTPISLSN